MKRNARAYHRQSSCEVKVFEGAGDKRLDDGIHTDPTGVIGADLLPADWR